jgi:hypothetical protein
MQTPDAPRGATPEEWWTFTGELGLAANVLPCVPASPDVVTVPGSALEGKVGKIPSAYNGNGQAHGIQYWQKRAILPAEVALWRKDRRLNLCVRTGALSGVYALDVDVKDQDAAFLIKDEIYKFWIENALGAMPLRSRADSKKFLVPFLMEGSTWKKRIIDTTHGRIEFLASGQQFVAAGSHSDGARYEWSPSLPSELPRLSPGQFEALWSGLSKSFGMKSTEFFISTSLSSSLAAVTNTVLLTACDADTFKELLLALRFLLDKVQDNDTWSEIGYALLSLKKPYTGKDIWLDFSRKAKGYTKGAPEAWWEAHKTADPRTDYRHIFTLARKRGWGTTSEASKFPVVAEAGQPIDDPPSEMDLERRTIHVIDAALPTNVKELSEIMRDEVYTQGVRMGRLGRENLDDSIRRGTDQLHIVRVSCGWARVRLTELATFMVPSGQSRRKVSAPAPLVDAWMDQTDWPPLRPLDAIARAPFVREDGSICDTPGYDNQSRTLYAPSCDYPPVPGSPTLDDARVALNEIRHVFDQFPWDTPEAESAFIAHILSEAARLALDRCPMFWYSAPNAGAGKSLLSEMPSIIVHGSEPALRPWVQDGDELRKTLFASLLAGDRSIAFDNVPTGHKARAPELCAFLTSAVWKDRKLGVSETHAVPNRAVVSASGNNVTPVSDLARRCVVVRLDANTERLKERRFRITNLRGYVMEHRARLLVHALTVIKAYRSAWSVDPKSGIAYSPVGLVPLPSFERWSRLVREPLLWLGLPDPCETQSETDDETGSLGDTFTRLVAHFGEREFTGRDIAGLSGGIADSNGELSSLLMHSGCSEPHSPLKVGFWLRGERDKVSAGYKLVNVRRDRTGTVRWQFKRVEERLA